MSEVDDLVTLSGGERVHTRALELVVDLERRDVRLWCTDGGLHVQPDEALTDAERAALREWREDVITLVTHTTPSLSGSDRVVQ